MATEIDFYRFLAKFENKKIKYLLFDCDNTLVESEDIAAQICSELVNEVLQKKGVPIRYSPEDLVVNFFGLSFRGILMTLWQRFELNISREELDVYTKTHNERVIKQLQAKSRACPGTKEVLTKLHTLENITLAVVSSSSLGRIHACLEKTGLHRFFQEDKIFSAVDSLPQPSGKPDPAIYHHALQALGAKAEDCLTVEDSMSGVRAAFGAGVKCLGYVGSIHIMGQRTEMANQLLNAGCIQIMWHWGNYGRHLYTVEAEEKDEKERIQWMMGI